MPASTGIGRSTRTPPVPGRPAARLLPGTDPGWRRAARPWLSVVLRLVLGGVWSYAGAAKASDLSASVRAVRAYRVLPDPVATVVGAGLPWFELALGVLIVVGVAVRVDALISTMLFAVFLTGIISAAARGLRIDCGCFGSGGQLAPDRSTAYPSEIIRDSALLLLALALARWPRGRLAVDNWIVGAGAG